MSVTVQITDTATAGLQELGLKLDGAAVMRVVGRSASQLAKAHFRELDKERPNQLGGDRTHFWRDAANSTSFEAKEGEARLIIDHIGVALRYFGGTVLPVASKYLTIPATPEAHGKRAAEFEGLEYRPYKGPRARGALTLGEVVFFWLVESVDFQPDPTVIPEDSAFNAAIASALADYTAAKRAQGVA